MVIEHNTLTGDELHIPFKSGLDASRSATPSAGDCYFATDTGKIYKCFTANIWKEVVYAQANFKDPDNLIIKANTTNPNYQVDVDADGINVEGIRLSSVNLTIDITASGANGLDTGSEAASTWYAIWIIYNPTTDTTAGLLSTSGSSPTMPSGYTKKRIVGWIKNNASSNFSILENIADTYHSRGSTPPSAPYRGLFYISSDEDEDSPILVRIWTGTKWKAIPTMDIS